MRFSRGGRLDTTLRESLSAVHIDRHRYVTMNYDGSYPGPTLVFCPGDHVTVHLINALPKLLPPQDTNLHLHGLHVSPTANHDNVYLDIHPGQRFTYQYAIPHDQEPGTFWYHPHRHMLVEGQVFAGLAGALIVQGRLDDELAGIPQRIMVIQGTELCDTTGQSVRFGGSGSQACTVPGKAVPANDASDQYTPLLVNSALNPTVHIRPGQIQRWRIINANADRIVELTLAGQTVQVLAEDGNTLRWMRPATVLLIGPGSRREILVRGAAPGRYKLRALPFAQHPGGDKPGPGGPTPNQTVLTVISSGHPVAGRLPKGPLSSPVDLRRRHADRYRLITFSEQELPPPPKGNTIFLLNYHPFNPKYVPITMKLGSVEQWTLVNTNTEWHTFHIHQNPFQVLSINGHPLHYVDYQDNVTLPPHGWIVIRMHPIDFTGKFVFHCHVTFHEDHGMMSAVQIAAHPTAAQQQASTGAVHGLAIQSSAYGHSQLPPLPRAILLLCHLLGLHAQP